MSKEEFTERNKAEIIWHYLNSEWGAVCGSSEAQDSENHKHSLTNQKHRVTCPNCKEIINKEKT